MGISTKVRLLPVAFVTAAALAACTGGGSGGNATEGSNGGAGGDVKITVWSWDGTVEKAVPGFEKANPGITVDVVNAGSSFDEYQALDNAIQAGSGVPDLAMFEYFAVPYFAIPGKLTDLGEMGAGDLEKDFVPVAELEVIGLRNRYRSHGIGAPLAAATDRFGVPVEVVHRNERTRTLHFLPLVAHLHRLGHGLTHQVPLALERQHVQLGALILQPAREDVRVGCGCAFRAGVRSSGGDGQLE